MFLDIKKFRDKKEKRTNFSAVFSSHIFLKKRKKEKKEYMYTSSVSPLPSTNRFNEKEECQTHVKINIKLKLT